MGRSITVECGCCRGRGCVELSDEYRKTYDAIRRLGGEWTGAALARQMTGVTGPAMNNRLAVIERHGLLVSRRDGRKRLYKLAVGS